MSPRRDSRQQWHIRRDEDFERRPRKKPKIERRHTSNWDDPDEPPEKENEFGDTYAFDEGSGPDGNERDIY